MNDLESRVIKEALANIGVHETSPNAGPGINVYLAFVGLPPGNPWCAAFACYRVHNAAEDLHKRCVFPKTGGCQVLFNLAKRKKKLVRCRPGTIFLKWYPDKNRYAHCGIVTEVNGTHFNTVEGNSNNNGSREGTETCAHERVNIAGHYVFVDINW